MKWLLYIFLFFTFTSCIDFKRSKYIERIDTSIEALNISKLKLDNTTFDSIQVILKEIKAAKSKIRTFLKNDTLPLNIALKIDEINRIESLFKAMSNQIPIAIKDIDSLTLNLNNLKKDIKNDSGNRAKYDEYIEIETANQTLITEAVGKYNTDYSTAVESFNKIESELKAFSNELELKNKEQKLIP